MKFNTRYNLKNKPFKGEKFTKPSQTTPDMSLSVRELYMNHSRGMDMDVFTRQAVFLGEDIEIPDIKDLTDIEENAQRLNEQKEQIENDAKEQYNQLKQQQKTEQENEQNTET